MENNAIKFIGKCGDIIGGIEKDNFIDNIDESCDSPIEQMLHAALIVIREINFIGEAIPMYLGKFCPGMAICPQKEIGKFRVDFEVSSYRAHKNTILIECDSQEWHERTEKERRYEKRRDRYLVSKGYKIFHFTGKEIMEKPFKIAHEVVKFLYDDIQIDLPNS